MAVLEALDSGAFGACDGPAADYRARCHALFPHAVVFAPKATNGVEPHADQPEEEPAKEISDGMS